ncbi:hypothetical protein GCM10010277_87810 [Streptomyces longisporoflavus]|uniref:hypothetical protein n=1 Tax=Streptomyces longisporoflavus TaxID=28044 RepID=UPI00167E5754|nr:hypothetical protein [Streptomyces longisporoflavus]GGV73881.1 hypothetical protein GCM10010277_87810 [Streptomyces longisporoflavus]
MSSSAAGTKRDISWMDRDNETRPLIHGEPVLMRPRPAVHRGLFLRRLRQDYNAGALEHLPNPDRPRRIVAYALNEQSGTADQGLNVVRALIARQGYDVVHELHDAYAPHAPQRRPGWSEARRLVHCGVADGIAVVDRDAVSRRDDEYEEEIHWIGQRPGLLLLAVPEAAT